MVKLRKIIKAKPKPVRQLTAVRRDGAIASDVEGLERSDLHIFDIPLALLIEHEDNANKQDEAVFDEIVDRIRQEGFDEPIIVYPDLKAGVATGKYRIASGHHRCRAAKLAGLLKVPGVIRTGWDEDRALIELVARNNLKGNTDPEQFTRNYNKLKEKYNEDELRRMMGLTGKKQFDVLYNGVKKQLSPRQQKKLEEAKEDIRSVEDLSAVLNEIFREQGTKLDKSMVVFSFGGKEHIYVKVDKPTHARLKTMAEDCEGDGVEMGSVFARMIADLDAKTVIRKVKSDGS